MVDEPPRILTMIEALYITGMGLAVVFGVMGVIAAFTWASGRVFVVLEQREKERKKAEKEKKKAEKERKKAEKERKKAEREKKKAEEASQQEADSKQEAESEGADNPRRVFASGIWVGCVEP